jgi:hypothetical protein
MTSQHHIAYAILTSDHDYLTDDRPARPTAAAVKRLIPTVEGNFLLLDATIDGKQFGFFSVRYNKKANSYTINFSVHESLDDIPIFSEEERAVLTRLESGEETNLKSPIITTIVEKRNKYEGLMSSQITRAFRSLGMKVTR